jgi:hypothetical protein
LSSPLTSGLCTGIYAITQLVLTVSRRSIGTCLFLFLSLFLSYVPSFFLLCFQSLSFLISNFPLALLFYTAFQSSPWRPRFLYFYSLLILFPSFRLVFFFSV